MLTGLTSIMDYYIYIYIIIVSWRKLSVDVDVLMHTAGASVA